jgi:hypothetical protein
LIDKRDNQGKAKKISAILEKRMYDRWLNRLANKNKQCPS